MNAHEAGELVVAEGWDADKVHAHLADLRESKVREEAVADAFHEAADQHEREAARIERQIASCVDVFSKPRATPATPAQPDPIDHTKDQP